MRCQQRLELGSHTLPVDCQLQRGHGVSLGMTGIGTKWKQHPVCQDDRGTSPWEMGRKDQNQLSRNDLTGRYW